jgi:predicted membrane protein
MWKMNNKSKMIVLLLLVLCSLTQGVFGDIVGPAPFGTNTNGRLLLIAPIILVIWVVCASIIKAVRNKNVDK